MTLYISCIAILGVAGILQLVHNSFPWQSPWPTKSPLTSEEIDELLSAPRIQLEPMWWQIIFITILSFAILTLLPIWMITGQAIQAIRVGESLPGNWTWTRIIFTDILIMLAGLFLYWGAIRDLLTVFTEAGIRSTHWLGLRHTYIKWSDIKRVELGRSPIKIMTPSHTIQLNLLLFKNPQRVVDEITKRVPAFVIHT